MRQYTENEGTYTVCTVLIKTVYIFLKGWGPLMCHDKYKENVLYIYKKNCENDHKKKSFTYISISKSL